MADIEKKGSSQLISTDLLNDLRLIIENGLKHAYQSVNTTMVHTYWKIGQRIVEEEQNGEKRAEYGAKLLEYLAVELSKEYATDIRLVTYVFTVSSICVLTILKFGTHAFQILNGLISAVFRE